jgi:hypothetical protein
MLCSLVRYKSSLAKAESSGIIRKEYHHIKTISPPILHIRSMSAFELENQQV